MCINLLSPFTLCRDLVVIDLTGFVLPPAGMIICQLRHAGLDADFTSHVTPIHEECNRAMHEEYVKLTGSGIASNSLILALLREYSPEHVRTVIRMLAKFGLLVPILKGKVNFISI